MAFRVLAGLLLALAMLAAPAWSPVWAQSAPHPKPWAHEASDIAPDPAVTWGRLPNGMRYALLRNTLPPGQVAMRLVIDFGSLHEAEHEKGLAHFIEHMAVRYNLPGKKELAPIPAFPSQRETAPVEESDDLKAVPVEPEIMPER